MERCEDFIHCQQDLSNECYKAFEDMRRKKEFCDVILNVGSNRIHAHRVILAAAIPYFRSLLASDMTAHLSSDIFLKDVSPSSLEALIDFAYKLKLKITIENAPELLSAACCLQIDKVRKVCIEFLVERTSPKNVFCFRQLGIKLNCSELVNRLDDYVAQNFEEITEGEDFIDLPCSYVKDLVRRDDVCVSSEEKVFEAIMNWIKFSPHQIDADIPELLSCVRMPFLSHEYLKDNVATNELLKNNHICRDIIDDARDYHLFPDRRDSKTSGKFSTTPRQYKRNPLASKIAFKLKKPVIPLSDNWDQITHREVETSNEISSDFSSRKKFGACKTKTFVFSKLSSENLQANTEPPVTKQSSNNVAPNAQRPKTRKFVFSRLSSENLQANTEPPVTKQSSNNEESHAQVPKTSPSSSSAEDTLMKLLGKLYENKTEHLAPTLRPNAGELSIEEFLQRRKEEWRKKTVD